MNNSRKFLMKSAWARAKRGASRYGGKASDYLGEAMRIEHGIQSGHYGNSPTEANITRRERQKQTANELQKKEVADLNATDQQRNDDVEDFFADLMPEEEPEYKPIKVEMTDELKKQIAIGERNKVNAMKKNGALATIFQLVYNIQIVNDVTDHTGWPKSIARLINYLAAKYDVDFLNYVIENSNSWLPTDLALASPTNGEDLNGSAVVVGVLDIAKSIDALFAGYRKEA